MVINWGAKAHEDLRHRTAVPYAFPCCRHDLKGQGECRLSLAEPYSLEETGSKANRLIEILLSQINFYLHFLCATQNDAT